MHCYKSESRKTAAQDPCDSQITFDFKYSLSFLPQRYRLVPVAQLTRLVKTIY